MLRARAKLKDGGALIILGLSAENMRRLAGDEPIFLDLAELGLRGKLLIFTGESEQVMAEEMQRLIGPDTDVQVDPRLFRGHD